MDVIADGQTLPLVKWETVGIVIREVLYPAISGRKSPKEALDVLAIKIDQRVVKQRAAG